MLNLQLSQVRLSTTPPAFIYVSLYHQKDMKALPQVHVGRRSVWKDGSCEACETKSQR